MAACCASPDDESLRIAYAQWLDERHDPRGEFLHLCCDLARVRWDSPRFRFGCLDAATRAVYESKIRRYLELRDACLETWTGLPREYAERLFFDRGFVVGYRTDDVDELMAVAPALFRHPVRELHLIIFNDDDVKTLRDCDFLHRLVRLYFTNGIGDRALRYLAASRHLSNLANLCIEGTDVTDFGLCALTDSPYLGQFQSIRLRGNAVSLTRSRWVLTFRS